jgi:hypothetical protein
MNYTIYSVLNGQILRNVQTSGNIDQQIQSNEAYINGFFTDTDYYVENNQPQVIPPKPSKYSIFDYTTKQWISDESLAIADVTQKRNALLYSSDWTQIPNNPLTAEQQAAWATYRQELRDISKQSGYPFNVIWPTPPQG